MASYILKRLLLIIPTLLGIMVLNFVIIQASPGGPVEQFMAQMKHQTLDVSGRYGGASSEIQAPVDSGDITYRGSQGIEPELIAELNAMYGFDKPMTERFLDMMWRYIQFDFGDSFFRDTSVVKLVLEKLPVSISLGLWTTLLVYFISVPLGIRKAVKDGSVFDVWTSTVIVIGYAIPSFLFALLLIIVFASGNYWDYFPIRGLVSDNWSELSWLDKITNDNGRRLD